MSNWSGARSPEHPPEPNRREARCNSDRGRVYGNCSTTTARYLRVAVTYTHTLIEERAGFLCHGEYDE
eukprot:scaffold62693_cov69-Phaeocystis_antarctica.AAC.1